MELVRDLVEELTYKQEQLKLQRGSSKQQVISGVTKIIKDLISGTISALGSRLSDPILSAACVFSPSTWPSDSSALASCGHTETLQFASHFEIPLRARSYEPEFASMSGQS